MQKSCPSGYAAAEKFYDARRINPKHRAALEYSGEMYLAMGNPPKAEPQLTALDKACLLPYGEYTDVKKAVQDYKAGKK
ncbi:MAG: hypothetical protein EBY24_22050 [Betaproteobacteria bacterium]|nr:hypothetical protein [Betaproteobacteria bacterium]